MSYNKFKPSDKLKHIVDFYYIWEKEEVLLAPMDISSSANNYCVMLYNYGDRYCLYNRLYNGETLPANFLAGQSVSPFSLELNGKLKCVASWI